MDLNWHNRRPLPIAAGPNGSKTLGVGYELSSFLGTCPSGLMCAAVVMTIFFASSSRYGSPDSARALTVKKLSGSKNLPAQHSHCEESEDSSTHTWRGREERDQLAGWASIDGRVESPQILKLQGDMLLLAPAVDATQVSIQLESHSCWGVKPTRPHRSTFGHALPLQRTAAAPESHLSRHLVARMTRPTCPILRRAVRHQRCGKRVRLCLDGNQ